MSRSIWKGIVLPKQDPTGGSKRLKPTHKQLDSAPLKNKNIKITPLGGVLEPRNVTITPDNVGKTYVVNIGKDKPSSKTSNNIGRVTVTTKHIGHKFGEYAISKIPAVYKRNSKNK